MTAEAIPIGDPVHAAAVDTTCESVTREVTVDCLITRARRISRILTGIYDQELRVFGINSPQFALLVVISRLGSASRAEIGRYNNQERSTLTRNLHVLLSEGWVEESLDGAKGRIKPIVLTHAGQDVLRRAAPAWRTAQAQAKALLGTEGATAVMDIANGLPRDT